MPKRHSIYTYKFNELSSKAKDEAREWFRQGGLLSDEQVDESIITNEYDFFRDGRRAVIDQYK